MTFSPPVPDAQTAPGRLLSARAKTLGNQFRRWREDDVAAWQNDKWPANDNREPNV